MKKFLSLFLVACTVFSLLIIPVSAGTVSTEATGVIAAPSDSILKAYVTANGKKTVTDVYNNCLLLTVKKTTGSEWNTYRKLLISKGYSKIVDKTPVSGSANKWALYANNSYVISCFYDAVDKIARISIEPRDVDLSVFTKPSSVKYICEPMLIQMGLDNNTSTSQRDTERSGMGYILRLADGRFIVYDGGFESTELRNADKLYNIMKTYAPTSGPYANKVVIAAWVLTHPHSDHIGAFMYFSKYYVGYTGAPATLQNVICNLPSIADNISDTNAVIGYGADLSEAKMDRYNKTLLALQEQGVNVYKAHVGQKYYFNEATVEILFTAENFLPDQISAENSNVHGTNATSIVSRVTWECSAYSYKALFTGDANYFTIKELNRLYGSDLSSPNFVQIPHHGCVSEFAKGTRLTALKKFYGYVDAYRSLMPAGVRFGYVNQCKTTKAIYDGEARLIGFAQTAGNPTPTLKRTIIAGSSVTAFTLRYKTKKIVTNTFAGADFYAQAPTLESTAVPYMDGNVYLIYNEAGLTDLKADRSYRMLRDMTITVIPGETSYPLLCDNFYGDFDGNGYSIVVKSESAIEISLTAGNAARGLLFNTIGSDTDVNDALSNIGTTVQNVNIYVPSITVVGSVDGQFGVIAGTSNGYTVIKNINLTSGNITKNSAANVDIGSMIGKAGAGLSIESASFSGKISTG